MLTTKCYIASASFLLLHLKSLFLLCRMVQILTFKQGNGVLNIQNGFDHINVVMFLHRNGIFSI